jgi:hypothetical protein
MGNPAVAQDPPSGIAAALADAGKACGTKGFLELAERLACRQSRRSG